MTNRSVRELRQFTFTKSGFPKPASCCALALFIGAILSGCESHPEVSSPESLQLIKQVYTAANTKNSARLKAARDRLNELIASNKLTAQERDSFEQIMTLANSGEWDEAQNLSLAFARAQIR